MIERCPRCDECQNGASDCTTVEPDKCVRFMPIEGTNYTKIIGFVETQPDIDSDKFMQYFTNWIESMGWFFCGTVHEMENNEDAD